MMLAGLGMAFLGWIGYSASSLVYMKFVIAEKEQAIAQFTEEYTDLESRSKITNDKLLDLANILDTHKTQLSKLVNQRSHLETRLTNTKQRLESVQAEAVTQDKAILNYHISDLENKVRVFTHSQINSTRSVQKAEEALGNTESMIASLIDERNLIASENARLEKSVLDLHTQILDLESHQDLVLSHIRTRTELKISELESAVKVTGLKLDDLLERQSDESPAADTKVQEFDAGIENVGGPFVKYPNFPGILDTENGATVAALGDFNKRLDHWVLLNRVLTRLPLSSPVVETSDVTSKYGKRRDPFKKTWAKHSGVDFGPGYKAPVFATAPGEVIFVGWRGPYGRTIDVDHGSGVVTRYSHLRKILVKAGEDVSARQRIGLVGSSGRSTGAHLHYEVRFDGKPIDPAKFLKAGKHVLETR